MVSAFGEVAPVIGDCGVRGAAPDFGKNYITGKPRKILAGQGLRLLERTKPHRKDSFQYLLFNTRLTGALEGYA
ncbi:MAG: hypothetical protein ACREVW_09405, partial [Burkholderiales bacterium]